MRRLFGGESGPIRHLLPLVAVGIIGVAVSISISIWSLMLAAENRELVRGFFGRAGNQAGILQSGIDDYWDRLYAVRALFDFLEPRPSRAKNSRIFQ